MMVLAHLNRRVRRDLAENTEENLAFLCAPCAFAVKTWKEVSGIA